jgi:ADP-ribose pyrophosphatase
MPDFEISRVEPIFEGHVFRVERRFVDFGGVTFDREILVHPGAVAVIAIDDAANVVLLEQYRAAVDGAILEIPAGTCDIDGESLERTAHRELAEEAGLAAGSLELLGIFLNSPGYSSQRTALFLATQLEEGQRAPDGVEEAASRIIRVPLGVAVAMMESGRIEDSTTCLGLLMAKSRYG